MFAGWQGVRRGRVLEASLLFVEGSKDERNAYLGRSGVLQRSPDLASGGVGPLPDDTSRPVPCESGCMGEILGRNMRKHMACEVLWRLSGRICMPIEVLVAVGPRATLSGQREACLRLATITSVRCGAMSRRISGCAEVLD